LTADPLQQRNRYYGVVKLAFAGILSAKLCDGRRVTVPRDEVRASGLEFSPGDKIEMGIQMRGDRSWLGIDIARVDDE
jgi:hypothetical protein